MSTFEEADFEVSKICCRLRSQCEKSLDEFMFVLEFVLRESFNNAVEHGNKMRDSEKVKYEISISKEDLTIDLWDSGEGFDVEAVLKHSNKGASDQIRNRGLQAIITFGFLITVNRGHIHLKHKMERAVFFINREDSLMQTEYIDGILTIKINCNLTAPNIKVLVEETKRSIEETKEDLQLIQMDLLESKAIDSMGITFLVGTFKTLSSQNKKMRLTGVSDAMLKLFKTMKLDTVFEIEKTVGGRDGF